MFKNKTKEEKVPEFGTEYREKEQSDILDWEIRNERQLTIQDERLVLCFPMSKKKILQILILMGRIFG